MVNTRIVQIVALLVVIFAAGIVIGVVAAPRLNPQVRAATQQHAVPQSPEQRIEQRLAEFTLALKLTRKQQDSIRELWRTHASETQRLNAGRRRRGRELFDQTAAKVRQQLTLEQQAEYDRLMKEVGNELGRLRPNTGQE